MREFISPKDESPPFPHFPSVKRLPGHGLVGNPSRHALPEDILGKVRRQSSDNNLQSLILRLSLGFLLPGRLGL